MNSTSLAKSHAEMTNFLRKLIRNSDKYYGPKAMGYRSPAAQRQYDEAVKLVSKAKSVISRTKHR